MPAAKSKSAAASAKDTAPEKVCATCHWFLPGDKEKHLTPMCEVENRNIQTTPGNRCRHWTAK